MKITSIVKGLDNIFVKFPPSENNHVYSISEAEQSKVPAFGVESC